MYGSKLLMHSLEKPARPALTWLLGWALTAACLAAPLTMAADSGVGDIQAMVRQWIALKQELSRLQTEWQEHQALLSDEMRLLERRKDELKKRLAEQDDRAEGVDTSFTALQARRQSLQDIVDSLAKSVGVAEQNLQRWQDKLPVVLLGPLRESFSKLPRAGTLTPSAAALAERLQLVLGIYAQLQQLTRSVHVGRMVLTTPDNRQAEMEVVFIGMAVAYAVSADDTRAAMGCLEQATWTWHWRGDLAPAVRQLLSCYRKESPAAFVNLPVQTKGDTP